MGSAQRSRASHRLEEHTGELKIHVEADRLDDVFAEAARALAEVMAEEEPRGPEVLVEVAVRAADLDALLVEWLNEIVFQSETHAVVFRGVDVTDASATGVRARLTGTPVVRLKTAVKAATYHGLRLERSEGRWRCDVILDV